MECKLLSGFFSYFIQFLLACICFISLIYKRHIEENKRPLNIWLMDITKQGIASLFGHFIGIFYAIIFSNKNSNECTMYLEVYIIDSYLGLLICFILLKLFEKYSTFEHIKNTGYYGNPPSLKIWSNQVILWTGLLIISKLICGLFILLIKNGLLDLSHYLAEPLKNNPKLLLIIVMILCPLILNTIQVWIQDNILKNNTNINVLELAENPDISNLIDNETTYIYYTESKK